MENKNILYNIRHYRDRTLDGLLNISSLFFISLAIFTVVFLLTDSNNPISILVIWMILLFVISIKSIPINTRLLFIKITNTIGSLFFLILFISSLISPQSFLTKTYVVYSNFLQVFLNQFFATILLTFISFIVFIEALKLILSSLGYLFDKLNANQSLRTIVVTVVVIASCIFLLITINKESSFSVFKLEPYLVQFFGFSLLYIHSNFLVREIIKLGQSSTISN